MISALVGLAGGLGFGVILVLFLCLVSEGSSLFTFLRKKPKPSPNEKISEGYNDALSKYNDLMIRVTPLKDMTVDELHEVVCSCGHKYSSHTYRECVPSCHCSRHSKQAEISYYLNKAPVVRNEPDIIHEPFVPYLVN